MIVNFNSIDIEGFQSIGKAYVELNEQGTVLIRGVNNYDDMASSNGSGKSSIPESILYALYGKTSSGISNPKNRYYPDGLCVTLKFSVDNTQYTVVRSIDHKVNKTGVKIYRGSDDISGRNATDTNKIIKDDIIPFDQDIFLSTIFLSQGFAGKLSSLTPAGRKERLETLTDTASQIDEFRDKMTEAKNKYSDEMNTWSMSRSHKEGELHSIECQIFNLENKIASIKASQKEYDIDAITKSREEKEIEVIKLDEEVRALEQEKSRLSEIRVALSSKLESTKSTMRDRKDHLRIMLESSGDTTCPTCGQIIKRDTVPEDLIREKQEEISSLEAVYNRVNESVNSNSDDIKQIYDKIQYTRSTIDCLRASVNSLNSQLLEASKNTDTSEYEKNIEELKASTHDINKAIYQASEHVSRCESLRDVANHCVTLISKAFRGYMLQEIVDFMNSRLSVYSKLVFSNESDQIRLLVDSTKLDIYLGDVLYDTLSGGERKKVDIALVLAQRDLSMNISGMSCNLLILDEILENCDATASDAVLNLLSSVASEIDSMFVISHNDYVIPYDAIITVNKGVDRIANISIS